MSGYIDLHVHSNYSDGRYSIERIKEMAIKNNIRTIALAEHYNLSSYYPLRQILKNQIEVIPAVELSASLLCYGLGKKHVCHIAAYYPTNKIYSIFDYYEISRNKCVRKTLDILKNQGIKLSYNDVKKCARNKKSIGRFDIAKALCSKGIAPTPESAYSKFFDENSPVYIDREKLDPGDLIKKILSCSGVPVLVHPKSLKLNDSDFISFISELKSFGLCGIEAYNPHNDKDCTKFFCDICDEFDLIKTVGSDFHGRVNEEIQIGLGINNNLCIDDYSIVKNLKKKKKELFD